jgi:periplasmic copper chaperone A
MLARLAFLQIVFFLWSCAGGTEAGLSVQGGWVREAPPNASALAGYMVIENHGVTPRKLIAAESSVFRRVEMHRSVIKHGVARMVKLSSVRIPPSGGRVAFRPNGYHLMMMQPAKPLRAGDKVAVSLMFDRGESLEIMLPVKIAANQASAHHAH